MIDPNNVTKFDRTDDELLEFWLFCLFVRGKNATVQAKKLEEFLVLMGGVEMLRSRTDRQIMAGLREVKAGQYNTLGAAISRTLLELARWRFFLSHATIEYLMEVPGVGHKTARYFILHTRKNSRVAALDTHILQFLQLHMDKVLPKSTPASAVLYKELEDAFLTIADFEGVSPAIMDLAIWRASREKDALAWRDYL